MVIDQIYVHRLTLDEAEDNAPVARNAHAPLLTSSAFQPMQPVTGQTHVVGRLRGCQFRQDATDTAREGLGQQSSIVSCNQSLQSFVRAPNATHYAAEARFVASLVSWTGRCNWFPWP